MKVMVIVKASKDSEAGKMPSQQLLTDMGNYNEELKTAGIMLDGAGLHPSSKGKRVRFAGQNRTVIDGPFAETKELIAGYWLWEVKSMDEAVEWLKRCPNPHNELTDVEIRRYSQRRTLLNPATTDLDEPLPSLRGKGLVERLRSLIASICGARHEYSKSLR